MITAHCPPRRRALRLGLALLAPVAALPAGCGFALRSVPALPFRRLALQGFDDGSPLRAELLRALGDRVQVVASPAQAEVVLHALADQRDRSVVASTAAGQVRELGLRLLFRFRLTTPAGRELIAPTELLQERDLTYSESVALAKPVEEAELYAAMQADVVQQVLARLARAPLG